MDLVRGKARFVGDIQFPDMLHACFVRSPHAHARIGSIDKRAALESPGVVAVLTSQDIRGIAKSDRLDVALVEVTEDVAVEIAGPRSAALEKREPQLRVAPRDTAEEQRTRAQLAGGREVADVVVDVVTRRRARAPARP